MTDNENLEELIKEYSQRLLELAAEKSFNTETKDKEKEKALNEAAPEDGITSDAMPSVPEAELIPETENEQDFSYFTARVFTASGAYAVKNAKVIIYKDDVLYAFLMTDENGETKRIRLASYPEINSLESDNPQQRVDYSADVFSDGFTPQKNLLISAVGGTEAVLNVSLVPESEGIS